MFSKKKLKMKISFIVFIFSICTFTMLQGFDIKGGPGYINVKLVGINDPNCYLVATKLSDGSQFVLYRTEKDGSNSFYYKEDLKIGDRYNVVVCFNNDGGSVQVIVKKGHGEGNRETDVLDPTHAACE